MRDIPDVCVLDASALVRVFIDMEFSTAPQYVFKRIVEQEKHVVLPNILYAECTNVFGKYVKRRGLSRMNAERYLNELLEMEFHTVSSAESAQAALNLAIATGASVYDASYGAVAQRFGAALITADSRLVPKFQTANIETVHLSEFAEY